MKTDTFIPSLKWVLLENVLVFVGIAVGTPIAMLSRIWSHPGMTIRFAVVWGFVAAILSVLYYTARFLFRVPVKIVVSESEVIFSWRSKTETRVRWDDVRRAVFRKRWGYRWKFFLDDSTRILWGDGFSAATWEKMSDLVVAQLSARKVPMESYDTYGQRVV